MKLKSYRTAKKLSLAQLAAKIGVANESVVRRYETGARMPRPEIIEKIWSVTDGKVDFNDHLEARREWIAARQAQPSSLDGATP